MRLKENRPIYQISKFISAIGHPALLVPVTLIFVNFSIHSFEKALKLTLIGVGLGVLPILLYLLYQVKKGKFENFDVSNQKKRWSVYLLVIGMQLVITFFLYFQQFDPLYIKGALASLVLTVSSFLINFKLKVSQHTAFSFFLATLLLSVNTTFAFGFYIFALCNGLSRLVLSRHKPLEVIVGLLVGILSGVVFYI